MTGQQPMSNEDRTKWIVFNGEIFNFPELRHDLSARGYRFRTMSDTEVLLRYVEVNGPEGINDLNGQFAFAVWDTREKTLLLARDRSGICPLFYTFCNGDFLFASEIKAIFADPRVSRQVDPVAIDDVFTFWLPLSPKTAFKGVREIPPAHWMIVSSNGERQSRRYWDLSVAANARCAGVHREEEYAAHLRHLLIEATRLRLRADVPVGAYLSGGLDSSITAGIVKTYFPTTELRTFSVRFHDREFDEGWKQDIVVRHLGARHEEICCSESDIARAFVEVIWHAESPLVRTAPAPLYLLSRLVRECGFKVVLTGEGADEILAGYDLFKEVKVRQFIEAAPGSVLRPILLRRLYPYLKHSPAQALAYARGFFLAPPQPFAEVFRSHAPRWNMTAMGKVFFSAELRRELSFHDPAPMRIAALFGRKKDLEAMDPLTRAQLIETVTLLPGYLLSSQGDRMLMAHSVEGRFPFLDHRVMEFCMRVPPSLRLKGLKEKYLLRKSLSGILPPEIIDAVKQPYRAPDARCFVGPGVAPAVSDLMTPCALKDKGYFDAEKVRRLVEKCRAGRLVGFKDNIAFVGILSTQILDELFVKRFPLEGELEPRAIRTFEKSEGG